MNLVKTSYKPEDAIILLKDLTEEMSEMSTEEREKAIQNGTHYSEMLPEESSPTPEYMDIYYKSLDNHFASVARQIKRLANMIATKSGNREKKAIIVSLARAGLPIGVLLKRELRSRYYYNAEHYSISIIRDKGIDFNAMEYIYNQEIATGKATAADIYFVDGWTGKGAILNQLKEAVNELKARDEKWKYLSSDLYVLSDPAGITPFCGTREDYMIPSACLNSTVSGLISRTILNDKVDVEHGDFHGAVYFEKFEHIDRTNEFIEKVWSHLVRIMWTEDAYMPVDPDNTGMKIVESIQKQYGVNDYKKIKPGIGETTRVLLRRVPWKVLLNENIDLDDPDQLDEVHHILYLCEQKGVPIERYNLGNYKVCGIIKELADA